MKLGYDRPLYILPFDHRHSYGSEVFGFQEPMTPPQIAQVAASKQLIYEGYQQALSRGAPQPSTGILVDEEFGAAVLRDATAKGYITAMPTEKSGQHEFDFEYGADFASHIEAFDPTFTKVLVRYNPQGDRVANQRQLVLLKQLSDYLHQHDRLYMFELLVPPEKSQLAALPDRAAYDRDLRPKLMLQTLREIQDAGVEPDVWKIEGLDRREDCQQIVATARRDGRDGVGCIVLGRGENEQKVIEWLGVAAKVPGFIGFAVGRSSFLNAIVEWHAGRMTRDAAIREIADKFLEWISVFENAH